MSADFPIEYNTRHVDAFLHKIAQHRDIELRKIDEQAHTEIRKIHQLAHAQARQLARHVISETRERERRRRDRYLYKLRSELTRERWGILKEVRERVLQDLQSRFEHAWADQDGQCAWCRFWVQSSKAMATPSNLQIRCGAGTTDATLQRMHELLKDYPGDHDCRIDTGGAPGLVVRWPDHYLDGTLDRQREIVAAAVLSQVAGMLNRNEPVETSGYE